jgi:hypothetical protein
VHKRQANNTYVQRPKGGEPQPAPIHPTNTLRTQTIRKSGNQTAKQATQAETTKTGSEGKLSTRRLTQITHLFAKHHSPKMKQPQHEQ